MIKGADISDCGKYRYALWRIWDETKPYVAFIGLNPSTADAENDDPTIRRCIAFAKSWSCGGVVMLNVYAYRATKPADMLRALDPVGINNDSTILQWCRSREVAYIVCAWGANDKHERGLNNVVNHLLQGYPLFSIGTTKHGHPRHPLYVKADTKPTRYNGQ